MMTKTLLAAFLTCLLFSSCGEKEEPKPAIKSLTLGPVPASAVEEFSGQKAYDHIAALTKFGPRPPESEGYRKSLNYLETELKNLGWITKRANFKAQTPVGPIRFTNLLARYGESDSIKWKQSPPYVLSGHLDSKRYLNKTFLGVNDSGSSTGVILEMARVLSKYPDAARQVELVFFDGEEAILENIVVTGPRADGLYGSINYAKNRLRNRQSKPKLAFVLDLVGDPSVDLFVSAHTDKAARKEGLKAVKTLDLYEKITFPNLYITDDHVPLMEYARLPVFHLIGDFQSMPYWHKEGDTMDTIKPEALENTGKFTLQVLHQLTTPK